MRASLGRLLADARGRGGALGAFTAYNLEGATGVVRAAEAAGDGVVLLIAEGSLRRPGGDLLVVALRAIADRARVPVALQLDHVSDLELMESAFALGVDAVMADGSMLHLEENAALVRAAAALAHRFGGEVEAELGRVEGDEDVAVASEAGALTDPGEAASFVASTGAACLAVSIGNVHGVYRRPPALDWERLAAVRSRVDVPLSLHGASGLSDADVRHAIALGVAKVNVNTELREAYVRATDERLPAARDGLRVLELNSAQTDAVAEAAAARLRVYRQRSGR